MLKIQRFHGFLLCMALFSVCAHSQTKEPVALAPLKAAIPLSPTLMSTIRARHMVTHPLSYLLLVNVWGVR